MDLLDKLRVIDQRRAMFGGGPSAPGTTVIDEVLGAVTIGRYTPCRQWRFLLPFRPTAV